MAKQSIVKKITAGSTLLVICASAVVLAANYWHAYSQADAAHRKQLARQLVLISQSLESPLWSLDDNSIKLIGDTYMTGAEAVSLKIVSTLTAETVYNKEETTRAKVIYGQRDITHDNQVIGHVSIGLSGAAYAAQLTRMLTYSIALAVVIVLALAFLLKTLFMKHLAKPLESLGDWTDRVASGDYGGAPPSIELEELSALAGKFSNMSRKIQNREESLQASERRFRGLFENTEVSIWNEDISEVFAALEDLRRKGVRDLRQHLAENPQTVWSLVAMVKVIHVNEATLKLFGAASHEQMLTQIDKTFGPESIEVFIEELCALWDRKKSFRTETTFRTLDGKELEAIVSFHIPETASGFKSMPISIIDITENKRAEEELARYRDQLELLVEDQTHELKKAHAELLQRERLATLGKLTATVSHELRNPLGTIQTALFYINDCLTRNEPQLTKRSLELAERSIGRCVSIIEELNSFTRVKALNIAETALDDWLQAVFVEQVIPDSIRCELKLDSGVRAWFDGEKLRQVIINLISNAVYALQESPAEEKLLQVTTHGLENEYEIRISDNGIGMTQETMAKIFEPLFSTKGFGVGLGMVIVKNIVQQHHGTVRVDSEAGKGTTVTLRLPVRLSES